MSDIDPSLVIEEEHVEPVVAPEEELPDDDAEVVGLTPTTNIIEVDDLSEEDYPVPFDPLAVVLGGCTAEVADKQARAYINHKFKTRDEVTASLENSDSKLHRLMLESQTLTEQPVLEAFLELIGKLTPEELMSLKSAGDDDSTFRHFNTLPKQRTMTDTDSLSSVMRKFNQIRGKAPRIPLVHSGITVELQAPGNNMAFIEMTAAISEAANRYGTDLGGLFYMNSAFLIKEVVWRTVIADNITWSSIKSKQWRNDLPKYISDNDFDALLIAIVQLMFPDGYDKFIISCLNPKCGHSTTINLIVKDIMRINEYALLERHPDALKHIALATEGHLTSPNDIVAYRNKVAPTKGKIIQFQNSIIFLETPSLDATFKAGAYYGAELQTKVRSGRAEKALAIQHSMLGTVSHWVSRIVTYRTIRQADLAMDALIDDPTSALLSDGITTDVLDNSAVMQQLLAMSGDDNEYHLFTAINNYADASRLSIPAIEDPECPWCHQSGTTLGMNKGFRVVNPLNLFFSSTRKALEEGTSSKVEFRII